MSIAGSSLLPDVPDCQCRDDRPQRAVGGEDAVIAMPVFSRLRDEIGEPVQELKRREIEDAVRGELHG
jgi:hypothetical protein